MCKTPEDADKILDFLNSKYKKLKFTIEIKQDQKLPALHVLITKKNNKKITGSYKKSVDTVLLTNNLSFLPRGYRLDFFKTLIDCLYKISNTWIGFHNAMEKTKLTLQKNLYPPELTEKAVKHHLSDQYNNKESPNKKRGRYFKLPYIGFASRHTMNKIKGILEYYVKMKLLLILFLYHIKSAVCFPQSIKLIFAVVLGGAQIFFVQVVMLITWMKLLVAYLLGPNNIQKQTKSHRYINICYRMRDVSIVILITGFLF